MDHILAGGIRLEERIFGLVGSSDEMTNDSTLMQSIGEGEVAISDSQNFELFFDGGNQAISAGVSWTALGALVRHSDGRMARGEKFIDTGNTATLCA